jgi:hypothetical protein
MGGELPRTYVVGCVPADLSEGIGLSQPVAAAVDDVATRRLDGRDVEGHHPGLAVHGQLRAILMAEAVRRDVEPPSSGVFTFRLDAPLYAGQGAVVAFERHDATWRTRVQDATGRQAARANSPLSRPADRNPRCRLGRGLVRWMNEPRKGARRVRRADPPAP